MNDVLNRNLPHLVAENDYRKNIISACVLLSLPLLMTFPKAAGWLAAAMAIPGLITLIRWRHAHPMDWQFLVICIIFPVSYLWNMLIMGWAPGFLERPMHFVWGLMIYALVGRYGIHRNTFFWAACMAAFAAFGIALYEAVYLDHSRVFGLGQRWNAVPFGNFSLLFGFIALCGIFTDLNQKNKFSLPHLIGLFAFFSGVSASLLSGTRGGWIAAPFLIALCIFFNKKISKKSKVVILGLAIIIVCTTYISSNAVRNRVLQANNQVVDFIKHPQDSVYRGHAVGLRLAMWQWGIEQFLEHPFTGIGLQAYKEERRAAIEDGILPSQFKGLANLHNELITSLAFGGLPSAFALIIFWIMGWRFFFLRWKNADDGQYYFALCGLVTILGTGIFSMTEGLFGTSPGTKAIMLSLAIPAGALRYYRVKKNLALTAVSCNLSKSQ